MSTNSANNQEKALEALDVMAQAERAVADYYWACSEVFPANRKFWEELSKQETSHADIISRMSRLIIEQGHTYSIGDRATLPALRAFIVKTRSNHSKVKSGQTSEADALTMAYHIESTFVEQKFSKAIRTDSVEFTEVLENIALLEERHRELVYNKWKESGKK